MIDDITLSARRDASFLILNSTKMHVEYISLLCLFTQNVLSEGISDDRKLDMVTEDARIRDATRMEALGGRSSYSRRKQLPKDLFSNKRLDRMKCDGTYPVAKSGYLMFDLAPSQQPCHYSFLGSRNERCTVAILCEGHITLAPPTDKGCEKEYLTLADGTVGLMSGCGTFGFKDAPRIPRNNGTDMYLYLKGSSTATCIAFCAEELNGRASHPNIKTPRKLTSNKEYLGFKTETSCKCGKRKDLGRVVGGENAFNFEFPWIGAVVFKGKGYERKPFCGGTLVSDRYFISAAHCFAMDNISPSEIEVVLHAHVMDRRARGGDADDPKYNDIPGWDLPNETDESENSIRMDVKEIKNHPLFNDRTFDYDIAVLKFTRAVNLKKGKVAPICLPYMSEHFAFEDGTTLVVAGWGRPWEGAPAGARVLQKLDVPFINLKDCDKYTVPSQRHVCAGYIEGGKDACSGDSGGPLIYQFNRDDNQYLLAGIVSAGAGCARENSLGLYTDMQELLQWAYHHMPDAIYCQRSSEQT